MALWHEQRSSGYRVRAYDSGFDLRVDAHAHHSILRKQTFNRLVQSGVSRQCRIDVRTGFGSAPV